MNDVRLPTQDRTGIRGLAVGAALLIGLLLPASGARASATDVPYGPAPIQRLDICSPPGGGPAPALLMIHGGGWVHGDKHAASGGLCQRLAARGMVVIPVDYQLADGTPAGFWPIQFDDVQLAVRWVRAHASEIGVDPRRVCVFGGSAGAQLALLLGVVGRIDPGPDRGLLTAQSPRPDCVVALSAPADMVDNLQRRPNVMRKLFGPGDRQAAAESASPLARVGPGAAPTVLIHGTQDPAVPYDYATAMYAALVRAGVPTWFLSYPGGHVMKGLDPAQKAQVWDWIAAFVTTGRLPFPPGKHDFAQ